MIGTAPPKPARGEFRRLRHAKRDQAEAHLRGEKAKVRARDGHHCRWPRCACRWSKHHEPLEVAHLVARSLEGADDALNMILLCRERHQGAESLHSKDLKIEPVYAALGTDGPCWFYVRDQETGEFRLIATERYVGVSEERGA